ncbi:hypothetical protein IWX90DRAFT_110961 [Phyllosticta citrichinensis]|uniref:Uncharacterized protein n=1 Tax=Phyllosticta citrichinensis TaxID=1130410 RepID=A0ABR1Y2T9_9PEZI
MWRNCSFTSSIVVDVLTKSCSKGLGDLSEIDRILLRIFAKSVPRCGVDRNTTTETDLTTPCIPRHFGREGRPSSQPVRPWSEPQREWELSRFQEAHLCYICSDAFLTEALSQTRLCSKCLLGCGKRSRHCNQTSRCELCLCLNRRGSHFPGQNNNRSPQALRNTRPHCHSRIFATELEKVPTSSNEFPGRFSNLYSSET